MNEINASVEIMYVAAEAKVILPAHNASEASM